MFKMTWHLSLCMTGNPCSLIAGSLLLPNLWMTREHDFALHASLSMIGKAMSFEILSIVVLILPMLM